MSGALSKEELHFLGRLIAFLELADVPEGLIPNVTISLDYRVEPDYAVVSEDGETYVLIPCEAG